MIQKIGSRSSIAFGYKEVTVTVRISWFHTIFAFAALLIFATVMGFQFKDALAELRFDEWPKDNFVFFILVFVGLSSLYQIMKCLFYKEESKMNLITRTLIRKNVFAGIVLRSVQTQWPKDAYFKYENIYDSYQRITAIWLISASQEKNESKRLIRFLHKDNFIKFRNLFNEKFPDQHIQEWHD